MNVDKLISGRHLHYILDSKSKISAVQISIEEWNKIVQKLKKYEVESSRKSCMWEPFQDEINQLIPELKANLQTRIQKHKEEAEIYWSNLPYGMNIRSYWKKMSEQI